MPDNRPFSQDQFGHLLHVAQPKKWTIIIFIVILLSLLILWAFLGRIPTELLGRGVALSKEGVFSVEAKANGVISDIKVKKGDIIDTSTILMTIYNAQLKTIIFQIKTTRTKIQNLEAELKILQTGLKDKEDLFSEGLVAKSIVTDAEAAVLNKKTQIGEAKAALINLFTELEKNSSCGKEEFEGKEALIVDAESEIEMSKIEKCLTDVYSSSPGEVLEVLVNTGNHIDVKMPLVWMEHIKSLEEGIIFYSCVPVQSGGRINKGMKVLIEPATVNPQEFGSMLGYVKDVSAYAISEQELLSTLQNRQLVNYLIAGQPAVTLILVDPIVDKHTTSGYKWTSEEGPPFKIPTGTVCTVKIVVEEQPPISYLIPLWKLKHPLPAND